MATNITVTLTDEQVAAALADARYLFPDATSTDLRDKLKESATYGPGVYTTVREWRGMRIREEENANRQAEEAAYEAVFPPKPTPEPEEPTP